jgi:DNA-binding NarL/FixJ family response regulator
VLQLLAEGFSMKQVAAERATTYRTVAFHKYRMMNNHDLPSNADLLRFAFEHGLVGKALKLAQQ